MKSTLNFYRVPFKEEQNKCIQFIELFLRDKRSADGVDDQYVSHIGEIGNFQFQKHALELKIKIIETEMYAPLLNANYVSVRNNGQEQPTIYSGKMIYYFITSIKPLSENCLELSLRMDTLNTFGTTLTDASNWSPQTLVEREHKERFFADENKVFSHDADANKYAIRVDEIPEGIQFPLYKHDSKYTFSDTLNSKFYLVYRSAFVYGQPNTDQSANAVKCFLVAEKGKHIPIYNYNGNAIDITWMTDLASLIPNTGDIIVFDTYDNPDLWYEKRYKDSADVIRYNGTNFKYAKEKGLRGFVGVYKQDSVTYRIFTILFSGEETYTSFNEFHYGGAISPREHVDDPSTKDLYDPASLSYRPHVRSTAQLGIAQDFTIHKARIGYTYSLGSNPASNIPTALQSMANWQLYKNSWTKQTFAEGIGIQDMMTIDQVDRTDSRLIKIIELPYAPNAPVANGSGQNLHYTFGPNWSTSEDYDEENMDMISAFQLVGDIEPDFSHDLSSHYTLQGVSNIGVVGIKPWSKSLETKLHHSDFYKHVLFYDNYSMEIKEECLFHTNYWADSATMPVGNDLVFSINFTASSNLTSGDLFSLHCAYDGDEVAEEYYRSEELYPLTLVAIRNNEVNLYNANFLQYIRSGYNYDMKAKSIQQKQGFLSAEQGLVNGLVGSVNSVGSGSASGVVHAFTGLFASFYNYDVAIRQIALQQAQAQNQIEKTLAQSAIQGTNVAGADNISLFNKYSGNKLHWLTMRPLEVYREKIATLFHYFGYASQKYKVPNITGRCFFNYVKCQPVFIKELRELSYITQSPASGGGITTSYYGSSQEIIADIVRKLNAGTFFIHCVTHDQFPDVIPDSNSSWNISMDKENWEDFLVEDWPVEEE